MRAQRHDTLFAGVRIQIIAKDDDRAIVLLLKAEPDPRFSAEPLNKSECGFVKLSNVFESLVFAAQALEIEIDAQAIAVVAQRVSDDLHHRLFLKQPALPRSRQICDLGHERGTIPRLVGR